MLASLARQMLYHLSHLNTYIHGNITRKLPGQLPLSQISKNVMFFFLSFTFLLLQNQRTGGQNTVCDCECMNGSV
jgi:hypothetical protein